MGPFLHVEKLWGGGWWCVAYRILVSAQGPLVLGFWVWGLGVWGLGLTIFGFKQEQYKMYLDMFNEASDWM